jgi:exopolyphosphatase/guanosine-5'-triphosphate,3'-diphosphate pyrophosphatase
MREAENTTGVKENLEHTIGAEIELISGEKEAELSFLGTIDNYESNIVIDIGGGSTEIIYGHSGEYKLRRSFETGAVKLTEKFLPDHSPDHETVEEMRQYINKCFSGFDFDQLQGNLYAVAGTPTTVASVALGLRDFEREKIEGYVLEESELIKIIQLFLNSTIEEIVEKYGVHPRRADVITAGSIILHRIMKLAGRTSLIVSARGLRYGILKTMI